ncbi:MAG: hypothetical protein ABW068_11265 [Candidatus Thiodiazotropha sp.]
MAGGAVLATGFAPGMVRKARAEEAATSAASQGKRSEGW